MQRDGAVAVIVVDNPPVNALKHEVRAGMLEHFTKAAADNSVEAIVLTGAGRTFMAGADITEFGKPMKPPGLAEVIAAIEKIHKPTIAAVHGTPLGGGLEVTLGCHFRVAAPGTRLGLPEIKLGIIPGAGGTQLLPRLVGVEKGLAMILSGDPIPAKDALAAGLVDEIIEGDLVKGAVAFAKKAIAEKRPLRHVRDLDDKIAPFRAHPDKFNEAAANVSKKSRGLEAPLAAIEAVRAAVTLPVDDGLKRERELFMKLVVGEQSQAQRYIFFAEREAAKIPDMPSGLKPREVARAVVIGAGTMGGGISMSFANAGIPVTVVETNEEALKRGFDTIRKNYQISVQRGALKQEEADRRFALLTGTTSMDAVKDADIVIEAVFEEMEIKKQVFGALDKLAKPSAVLATNTSYLNVDQIAQTTKRPKDVLGTHFFSPANVMKLLEIVRGKETAPDVLATAMAVGRKIGKVPGRAPAPGRQGPHRLRLPDGAVRDERPRRHRRRLAHPQGARHPQRDRRSARRQGALRPEDRARLLYLREGLALADPRSRGRGNHRRRLEAARHRAACDRQAGDRRAAHLPDDQDVLCRPPRLGVCARPAREIRQGLG